MIILAWVCGRAWSTWSGTWVGFPGRRWRCLPQNPSHQTTASGTGLLIEAIFAILLGKNHGFANYTQARIFYGDDSIINFDPKPNNTPILWPIWQHFINTSEVHVDVVKRYILTRPGFACRIKLTRARQSADLELDGEVYNSRVAGSYYELNTHQTILFGEPKNKHIILSWHLHC